MDSDITYMLDKMKANIENCEILSHILEHRLKDKNINMQEYMEKGYTIDEIHIGIDIIDLYINLIDLVESQQKAIPQ